MANAPAGTGSAPGKTEKKKEGRLGVILTAVGCLAFLLWFFRPEAASWQARAPADYIADALREDRGTSQDSWLIDLDLLELSVLQGGMLMPDEAVAAAKHIREPRIQARALRQVAQQTLATDARMGTAPDICDHIADPALRAVMKEEVLAELALLGYAESVTPRAESPRLQAALAASLAQGGEMDKALPVLKSALAGEKAVAEEDRAVWTENIALTRIRTVVQKGSTLDEAAAAIRAAPPARQSELWTDLFRTMFGAGGEGSQEARKVLDLISDPVLRRTLELESVQSPSPLRPGAEFVAEARQALDAAKSPLDRANAMLALADTYIRVSPLTDATPELKEASQMMVEARTLILTLPDPATRAVALLSLAEGQTRVIMAGESQIAITDALSAIESISDAAARLPIAVDAAVQAFHSGLSAESARAARTAADALAAGAPATPAVLRKLSDYHLRSGDWKTAAACVGLAPEPERPAMLEQLARLAAEQAMGYSPSEPPPRGPELDAIRDLAISDEREAAAKARNFPAGPARARALLAVAKGLLLPPGLPPNISGAPAAPAEEEFVIPEELPEETAPAPANAPPPAPGQ